MHIHLRERYFKFCFIKCILTPVSYTHLDVYKRQDAYWIDSFFFSSPRRVVLCLIQLWTERSLPMHIGITLLETILSFLLVFVVSLLLATLLWFSDKLSEILEPYLVLLNSLPKSALAPLFIVWLGTGISTIIIAGISVAVFGSIISFYTA